MTARRTIGALALAAVLALAGCGRDEGGGADSGEPLLDRSVRLRVEGLAAPAYELRHLRVDLERSNIAALWEPMSGGADWPDDEQWAALREANRLEELEPSRLVDAGGGVVELAFDLPMPSVSLVELVPAGDQE